MLGFLSCAPGAGMSPNVWHLPKLPRLARRSCPGESLGKAEGDFVGIYLWGLRCGRKMDAAGFPTLSVGLIKETRFTQRPLSAGVLRPTRLQPTALLQLLAVSTAGGERDLAELVLAIPDLSSSSQSKGRSEPLQK